MVKQKKSKEMERSQIKVHGIFKPLLEKVGMSQHMNGSILLTMAVFL